MSSRTFSEKDLAYLAARYVLHEDAAEGGCEPLSCPEWEALKTHVPHLPHPGGKDGGVDGLLVRYPATLDGEPHVRVRPHADRYYVDTVDGKGERHDFTQRWLTNGGVEVVPYILSYVLDGAKDKTRPILFAEGPIKALACKHAGHLAIGLGGVEAGGHDRSEPTPTIHPELRRIDWRGRPVYIVYDAGIWNNPAVARGAARLAHALREAGAIVRVAFLPLVNPHDMSLEDVLDDPEHRDQGPDDFLAKHGPEALQAILDAAPIADPVERVRLIMSAAQDKDIKRTAIRSLLSELFFAASLRFGGSAAIDGVHALVKPLDIVKKTVNETVRTFDARVAAKSKKPGPEWMNKLLRDKRDNPISSVPNAITVLSHDPAWHHVLAWDEFSVSIVKQKAPPFRAEAGGGTIGPWTEEDDTRLVDYLGALGINVNAEKAFAAVSVVARCRSFHPVKMWLNGLPETTEQDMALLDSWLTTFLGVKASEYARLVGRIFFLQMVATIYEPGCKCDYVMVFESEQGESKSQTCEALVPQRSWFSDTPFTIGNKDSFTALRGKHLSELAELASLMRSEPNASKAFFTSRVDNYRNPYAKHNVDVPRQTCFIGTINPEGTGYFKDKTGNRRYHPVAIGIEHPIDLERLKAALPKLYAAALALYKTGERRWPTREEEKAYFIPEQAEREEEHAWTAKLEGGLAEYDETTVAFVLGAILKLPADRWKQAETNIVATLLKKLGFRRHVIKEEKDPETGKRPSVKVYRRIVPLPTARPFDPAWTTEDEADKNRYAPVELDAETQALMDNVN